MEAEGGTSARLCDHMGLPVTCSSREALRLFDELLLVHFAVYDSTLPLATRVLELEPNLTLVHCLLGFSYLSDLVKPSDPKVSPHLEAARAAVQSEVLTERETGHVRALLAYATGNLPQAVEEWTSLLLSWPRDMLAVRVLFVSCIILGEFVRLRDFLAAVLPHWSSKDPAYPHLLGFYAFSLEETNYKQQAEETARAALDLQKKVPWATHALSHVIEESRPVQEGVEFLTSTRQDWVNGVLGGHINWHLTLFYLGEELGGRR